MTRTKTSSGHGTRHEGFTLLELMIAFALLALFVLPVLEIVHQARVRAVTYTQKRLIQDLAQRKLFERIYYYSEDLIGPAGQIMDMQGTFAAEGHPEWEWEIPYPQIVNQGEQELLEYTIRVFVPELGERKIESGGSSSSAASFGFGAQSFREASYEMTTLTFPSEFWYEEQETLAAQGIDTGYYGGF